MITKVRILAVKFHIYVITLILELNCLKEHTPKITLVGSTHENQKIQL